MTDTMNYKPRFLIQAVEEVGEAPRIFTTTSHPKDAEALEANLLAQGYPVVVTDRALLNRASTPAGARARGYYGLRYTGSDINSYVGGKIDRMADEALDDLDDLVEQKEVSFEARHRNSWLRAEQTVRDNEWERVLHAA